MFCKNCGRETQNTDPLCASCGARRGDGNKFCPRCGHPTEENAAFCGNCGAPLAAPAAPVDIPGPTGPVLAGYGAAGSQPAPGPQPGFTGMPGQQTGPASQQPAAELPPAKRRVTAGLLGIFLGGIGAHNFYLGYINKGILQAVLFVFCCGIPTMIWGFVEGVLILSGL